MKITKSVCFTGHRTVKRTAELEKRLSDTLERLIVEDGAADFYSGGAVGWDMICEQAAIILRERYPKIKLHLVLPCPEAEQTAKLSDEYKDEYKRLIALADTVEILSERYTPDCMKRRNARLVELADICVCYYNENDGRSGTGQTVRMAEQEKKQIINLAYNSRNGLRCLLLNDGNL